MEHQVPRLDVVRQIKRLKAMSASGHDDRRSEQLLIEFCADCPDPARALHVVLDAPRGASDEDIAETAMSLPRRAIDSVPASELPVDHPLRRFLRR